MLSRVVYFYSTYEPEIERINSLEGSIISLVKDPSVSKGTRTMAINNLVFAYLNLDSKRDFQSLLGFLSNAIRIDPYSTATLGMFHLKGNKVDQGSDLYQTAISLLHDRKTKAQFKQRFNFELGSAILRMGDKERGGRILRKAIDKKNGLKYLNAVTERKLETI